MGVSNWIWTLFKSSDWPSWPSRWAPWSNNSDCNKPETQSMEAKCKNKALSKTRCKAMANSRVYFQRPPAKSLWKSQHQMPFFFFFLFFLRFTPSVRNSIARRCLLPRPQDSANIWLTFSNLPVDLPASLPTILHQKSLPFSISHLTDSSTIAPLISKLKQELYWSNFSLHVDGLIRSMATFHRADSLRSSQVNVTIMYSTQSFKDFKRQQTNNRFRNSLIMLISSTSFCSSTAVLVSTWTPRTALVRFQSEHFKPFPNIEDHPKRAATGFFFSSYNRSQCRRDLIGIIEAHNGDACFIERI